MGLVACSTSGPRDGASVAPASDSSNPLASQRYEARLDETAQAQDRQGRLADESVTLELLAILRPDDRTLDARRQALRERIVSATQDHLRRAAEASKRGQYDTATNQYLAALALSPDNRVAADALRALENERNRRALAAKNRTVAPKTPVAGD